MDYLAIAKKAKQRLLEAEGSQIHRARIIGTDRIELSYSSEECWHCHSTTVCGCASCGHGMVGDWRPGKCGACLGTGYLTWGRIQ